VTTPSETEIFIVEDDSSLRKAFQRLLEEAGYAVSSHPSAEDYLAATDGNSCHCLLLDVRLPGLSGVGLQQRLQSCEAPPSIVFMTGHGNIPAAVEAIQRCAVDYLTKPVAEEVLLAAIGKAEKRCREERKNTAARRLAEDRVRLLSERELDVMRLVVTGLPNKAIAVNLSIALSTVKIHRGRVMEKMQAASLVDLVKKANRAGI
jgi:two-component system response regulator FixJ